MPPKSEKCTWHCRGLPWARYQKVKQCAYGSSGAISLLLLSSRRRRHVGWRDIDYRYVTVVMRVHVLRDRKTQKRTAVQNEVLS